ncbi:glycosyltransferase family 92 protein RCOM_0530710-like [Actinidia eriantha]|uniref:glycosyltransferase family 92 protein RCOM_0530710-like n=1 Tax=Actinidia eriantha TaxID=165200 RepID=UPI00258F5578|nr:glycosyltransferase family 92 protein RCOM_0530710-like [Actinidia eriantha]
MDSDQRRKRKRTAKPLSYNHFFSVRSLLLCFAFVAFLYLFTRRIPMINPSSFRRPVLIVPSFPLLSSSSTTSLKLYPNSLLSVSSHLKIEDQVLFPDHVLLIVSNANLLMKKRDELELVCVYREIFSNNYSVGESFAEISKLRRDSLSVDEYNKFQSIVRCPLPPANYSVTVNLEEREGRIRVLANGDEKSGIKRNRAVHNWDSLVYSATLDGDTAVLFVKGLNLRPDRASDASQFSCHIGLGRGGKISMTKAVSAAQEVVRCLLPRRVRLSPSKAEGVRVTIGVNPPHVHAWGRDQVLLPSVAKIVDLKSEGRKRESEGKYELCVCTMVWNQAPNLREWVMYHAWLGIERWFVYDNNSDDAIKEAIEELELEDYNVSRHVWPWIKTQEAGFSHCALRARDECNWVGFMDVDEFLYFPFRRSRKLRFPGQNSLRNLLANFSSTPKIAEIRMACHSFGPSGLISLPAQGVTVGYTCRLQSPERHKSIVRPDALDVTLLNVVHHFRLRKGFRYLNLPQNMAVINHYKYQVWESFRAKFFRRVATYVADWQENQNEGSRDRAPGLGTEAIEPHNWHLQFCEVWDTGLRDFVLANLADRTTGLLPWERTFL